MWPNGLMYNSPGLDQIPIELIKPGICTLDPLLLKVFNILLTCGEFPEIWRLNTFTHIHKKVAQITLKIAETSNNRSNQ